MWLGFDLCLSSGSFRRLRGAGRVGSGVHGVVRPRRVRGGACGPAVGRWPHWESHKRAWRPKPDKDKHKNMKGKSPYGKKGEAANEVAVEEDTPTTDAP